MIHLTDVNEENWIDIIKLSVNEEQQKFLDRPIGIIARENTSIVTVMLMYLVLLMMHKLLVLHQFEILQKNRLTMIYNSL